MKRVMFFVVLGLLLVLQPGFCRASGSTLTGSQANVQTFIRDYDTTHPKAVGDVLSQIRSYARENDILTTQSLVQTSISAMTPSITSTFSILTLNAGVFAPALSIVGGNVGINTATPSQTLDVNGDIAFTYNKGLVVGNTNPVNYSKILTTGWNDAASADFVSLYTAGNGIGNSTPKVTMLSNGNVGVGDVTPASMFTVGDGDKFQVNSNGNITRINNVPYSWAASQGGSNTFLRNDGAGYLSWASAPTGSQWTTSGNNIYYNSGNVGIGVTNPDSKLTIFGGNLAVRETDNGNDAVQITSGSADGTIKVLASGLEFIHLQGNNNSYFAGVGNFGVGTTTPQEKVNVNGNVLVQNGKLWMESIASAPASIAGRAGLFAVTSGTCELKAIDSSGNITQLSSHAEPKSGFDAPGQDPLPWSMNHANTFIGKGQVVNMSRLVRLVEEMSGQQLSEEYDLPADWKTEYEPWKKEQVEKLKADYIQKELDRNPTVVVDASEALSADAAEGVTSGTLNLKEGYSKDEKTGRYVRHRRPDEVKVPAIKVQDLPDWVLARIGKSGFGPIEKSNVRINKSTAIASLRSKTEGESSVAVGGESNSVMADRAASVGGQLNGIFADDSAVLAGMGNQAGGSESVILGGHGNVVNGSASVVSGVNNRCDAGISFVGGRNLDLTKTAANSFAWDAASTTQTITASNAFLIFPSGSGGAAIGTDAVTTGTRLEVAGGDIRLTGGSLIVDGKKLTTPDYVFEPGYRLMPIEKLREYVNKNGHLPGVPSKDEIMRNGLDVTRFQMHLLEKIEEQSRYILNQDETIKRQQKQIDELKKQQAQIDELKSQLQALMQRAH